MLGGFILTILALFLPPLAVIIRRGCGADLLINIFLCFLAWIPGVLHAWYIIVKYPSHSQRNEIRRRQSREHHHHPPRARSRSRSTAGRSHDGYGHHGRPAYGNGYARPAPPPQYSSVDMYGQQTGYVPARKY